MKRTAAILSSILLCACARAGDFDQFAVQALGDIAAYSHKTGYSPAVSDVYIGYSADGQIVSASAMREIKTYSTVNGLVAVSQKDGRWIVSKTSVPDVARIKDQIKRQNVLSAARAFSGRTVKDTSGGLQTVDAVTGATPYQESVYLGFNLLARTAVEAAETGPDWPKTPVSK